MQTDCNGALTYVILTRDELQSCGATLEHVWACGIFNQLTSIDGVIASVGVVEGPDGKGYCEFRSRGGLDVKEIAVSMGGGGHLAASGCNRSGPLDELSREAHDRLRQKITALAAPGGPA